MSQPLLTDDLEDFLERFGRFHDAVIREVHILFGYRSRLRDAAAIVLSVQDSRSPRKEGWVNVSLRFDNVREFSVTHSPEAYHQVISDYIHIRHLDGLFFVDLGGSIDEPKTIQQFKTSRFYFAVESIQWELLAYTE